MGNFNLQADFVEYWDKVVSIWLDNPQDDAIVARRPLPKKKDGRSEVDNDCYYKEEFKVNMEREQLAYFKNDSLGKLLCPAHLPEPYWGNPMPAKCSIVVVDYNPAGGTDMNPHSYKGTTDGIMFPPNTIINFVKEHSYSELAKAFPIWKNELPESMEWLCSYGGRRWWLKKREWIQHLVGAGIDVEKVPPFAIELCGWHSPNWPDNTKTFKDDVNLQETIKKRFALPLSAAIENSTSKLAICIGAQFRPSILKTFLPSLKNITQGVYNLLKYRGLNYPDNPGKKEKWIEGDESISVTVEKKKNDTTRYYRVYSITDENGSHLFLNTFAPGGNRHPAQDFWEFEEILLKAIQQRKA